MILSFAGLVLVVALVIKTTPILFNDGGNLHQKLHWIVYGYDRVWYHNRTYLGPSKEINWNELESTYGQGEKFIATGDKVIGLPVYDTPRSLAFQKQRNVVSTLLFLKKPDGNFVVYSLSGGP
ncbi:hypothetical protein [Alicyclobacillus mengziensis]|uniref:Uncharacterized protein n=1 Tax=Alicyclobacillus mengziensis TaxID=2931921 RepID=A0A9X7W360_9BACL|nr:hypothetical protein [Alicyclobacillus mengziensis]QSO48428.1 hypothetical protein JZ786_05420 [Alicyclobacillus mengziensis]